MFVPTPAFDTTATLITEVRQLRLENAELRRKLEDAVIRDIESRNPGIDCDAVRRYRKRTGDSYVV